ncbi:MAG TPA: hypothetical protein VD978_06700 [Azospirillum sp.]|nr:hypothetical protein [Azospirillum sp.]
MREDITHSAPLILEQPLSSPEEMFRRFRRQRSETQPIVRRLELDWPCSADLVHHLGEYLTDVVCAADRRAGARREHADPVLFLCLDKGLSAYHKTEDEPDDYRFLAFAEGVFGEAARLLAGFSILDRDGQSWLPGQGAPLLPWLTARGPATVEVRHCHRRGASADRILVALAEYTMSPAQRSIVAGARAERRTRYDGHSYRYRAEVSASRII